jgi:ActR/RegA family two-component response regulator
MQTRGFEVLIAETVCEGYDRQGSPAAYAVVDLKLEDGTPSMSSRCCTKPGQERGRSFLPHLTILRPP